MHRSIRLLAVIATLVLAACAAAKPQAQSASTIPAWDPSSRDAGVLAPQSGRVGVMSLVENELTHVHAGTTPLTNFETVYPVNYDLGGFVVEELRKGMLTQTPYLPVMVRPTGLLLRNAATWQERRRGAAFRDDIQRELDGIIKQNRLDMLIIISAPKVDDGITGTGQKLVGSGLYTRSFLGSTQTAVFSTIRFHRLVGTPARLVKPVVAADERSIGDLSNVKLPDDLDDMNVRYLAPVYKPLYHLIRNKVQGLLSLPRKVG